MLGTKGHSFFRPDGLRTGFILTMRNPLALRLGPPAYFCPECCTAWSKAGPRDATEFFEKFADDELKGRLAAIQIGAKAES